MESKEARVWAGGLLDVGEGGRGGAAGAVGGDFGFVVAGDVTVGGAGDLDILGCAPDWTSTSTSISF